MITAVDSSVLIDVLGADRGFGAASRSALRRSAAEGGVIACDVVWAEVVAAFSKEQQAVEALRRLGVTFSATSGDAASAAGAAWRAYRERGGGRARLVGDFLIGAHARMQAERLLTRDRGFYRAYFSGLRIIDPSSSERIS